MTELGTFEGRDVIATPIVIRKAGDGLSKSLDLDPVIIHQGDDLYVVLKLHCDGIKFKANKDRDDMLDRVADCSAVLCTVVEEKSVAKALAAQARKFEQAKEMKGQEQMDIDGEPDGE